MSRDPVYRSLPLHSNIEAHLFLLNRHLGYLMLTYHTLALLTDLCSALFTPLFTPLFVPLFIPRLTMLLKKHSV